MAIAPRETNGLLVNGDSAKDMSTLHPNKASPTISFKQQGNILEKEEVNLENFPFQLVSSHEYDKLCNFEGYCTR